MGEKVDLGSKSAFHPISRLRRAQSSRGQSAVDEEEFALRTLLKKVEKERGLDCSQFRLSYLKRRLLTRLRAKGVSSYFDYVSIINCDEEEYRRLIDAITVNVSTFFRDLEVFESFDIKVLPTLLKKKKERGQKTLRIWSAGCATGEEPYSIAMILRQVLGDGAKDWLISIYATDVDERSMEVAKKGVYPKEKLASIPLRYLVNQINKKNGHFEVSEQTRKLVKFKKFDLFADNNFGYLDIVFCRNVLIYFGRSQQEKLGQKFYQALNNGGFLIIGKTEKLMDGVRDLFKAVESASRIYQKINP